MLPPPSALINHSKFNKWYPGQSESFSRIMDWMNSPSRFMCASMPTGSGKSLLAMLAGMMGGRRMVVLTVTKGLQAQLLQDFRQVGLEDIRGQNSFPCKELADQGNQGTVDEGPCHAGIQCQYKAGGCIYYDQLRKVERSKLVVTNYAYYLAQCHHSSGLGDVGLLVMDEAHLAFQALESHLTVQIRKSDAESTGINSNPEYKEWEGWKEWAAVGADRAKALADKSKAKIRQAQEEGGAGGRVPSSMMREYRHYASLTTKFENIARSMGRWVWVAEHGGWRFVPVWPGKQAHLLYQMTPKVLVMSATMTPKTAESLAIPEHDRVWLEAPSYFPTRNSPVAHIKTVRVNYRTTQEEMRIWAARIDQLIGKRLGRKGIVFTVSYDRRNYLLANSEYRGIMHTHAREDVYQAVEKFKKASAPAVLVSPSVTSGWDFPNVDGVPFYIIVGKIPYPDSRDPAVKARTEDDKEWSSYLAMMTLVQESGRGTRSEWDKCEILIVDDSWSWFWPQYKKFTPRWFQDRVLTRTFDLVPEPLV